MKRKVFGFDVDEVIFDMFPSWMEWIDNRYDIGFKRMTEIAEEVYASKKYDLMPIFEKNKLYSAMDFWKESNLYIGAEADPICIETILSIKKAGHEVLFVSNAKPEHTKSKINRINSIFGDSKFIFTAHKEFVNMDFFIDDRSKNCRTYALKHPDSMVVQFMPRFKNMRKNDDLDNVVICENWIGVKAVVAGMGGFTDEDGKIVVD